MKIVFEDENENKVSFHAYDTFPDVKIIQIETREGEKDEIMLSKSQIKVLRDFLFQDKQQGGSDE